MLKRKVEPGAMSIIQHRRAMQTMRLSDKMAAATESVLVHGITQSSIARQFGLHRQAVSRACANVTKVVARIQQAMQDAHRP